jgi:poly-gamma-glutamate capsule biosynthesis protein CapA/YwtB (metallophosphatase superfamily)
VPPAEAVRVAALGDLMLAGEWEEVGRRRGEAEAFGALRRVLAGADLVFLNLETTVEAGEGHIPKEPRVIGSIGIIERSLAALGVDLVNLANNHAFDGYLAGFEAVRAALERAGVPWFGAGRDAEEAARPCVVERGGVRLGWLGYVALDTRPSHVAGPGAFGANPLHPERALADVARLRPAVDHVIVSLHWGVEFCHLPSPEQREIARGLVDRGASLVIGHHAHVVQGVERHRHGVIAYGLGNATTTDFAIGGRLAIRQTRRTRSSLLLRATLDRAAVREVALVPLREVGGRVVPGDAYAGRLVDKANRLLRRRSSPGRWRARRLVEDVLLRTLWKLDPRVVRSVRPRHVAKVFRNLGGSLTGRGPA